MDEKIKSDKPTIIELRDQVLFGLRRQPLIYTSARLHGLATQIIGRSSERLLSRADLQRAMEAIDSTMRHGSLRSLSTRGDLYSFKSIRRYGRLDVPGTGMLRQDDVSVADDDEIVKLKKCHQRLTILLLEGEGPKNTRLAMAEEALLALLRSSEHLKAILVTEYIPTSTDNGAPTEDTDVPGEKGERSARILAVVAHTDGWRAADEGSVFICKFRSPEDGLAALELEIQCAFPITEDFAITMAQARRNTIILGAPPGTGQPTARLYSDNRPGKNDVKALRHLLMACKELQKIYDSAEKPTTSRSEVRFRWLLPYTTPHELPHTFGIVPQDLRLSNQALHTQLSPAAAGSPGDDIADIRLIQDEWIRTQARDTSRKGRCKLGIRLGTFNVNGKLPSQDLSGWVMGQQTPAPHTSTVIPPLKGVSPLLLGEVLDAHKPAVELDTIDKNSTSTSTRCPPATLAPPPNPSEPEFVGPGSDPDMIVLGFQELDLSTEALLYSIGTAREDAWCMAVFAALGEKGVLYTKLASRQLVGMLLVVLVRKTLAPCFTDVRTCAAGAGIMGVMGNKGGTAIRIKFTPPPDPEVASPGPTTLTFVNAHLAAFDEMFEKRNSDFHDLSKKLIFDSDVVNTIGLAPLPVTLYESDVLFWMGGKYDPLDSEPDFNPRTDLNYRLDLPDTDVREILSSPAWEGKPGTLLRYDQLKKAIRTGRAFSGFNENPITHLPTYRFSHGAITDGLGYDIKRKPAWTDRILYMSAPTVDCQQLSYTSHPHITMSDHRPVAADFVVEVDRYDKDLQAEAARKLHRTVRHMEDSADRPTIKLDSTSVDMGQISYRRATTRTVRLQNIGKRPCAYRFVAVGPNLDIHPGWLCIAPTQGLILPGETAAITLTAYVDNEHAAQLNLGPKDLAATLIMHTVMGKDHFITVSGEYMYTCFASSLSRLTRLPGPVRSLASPDELRPEDQSVNAPREVMRLVNTLMSDYAHVDELFLSAPDEGMVDTIRDCLDTAKDFPFSPDDDNTRVAVAFGATLVRLLESLVDPVVPASLHPRCVQVTSRDAAFELLDAFPPASVNVWITLTAFLHFICQSAEQSSTKAESIATILAPVLLRDDLDSPLPVVSPLGKRDFLLYFIS
ncbi:putative inositol polyphosphate phosphatase, catalytic domain homologues [Lyophyllum shimeji]|uniref:Inositol polyphosphate phosphatase, catalytic domain homologues n=1 Tax=Lyophyllum shimeji TaxID=47721 RepID=A0A9P3UQ27_LYOSH|nr:putative inositol polyphosphate phosphatase, catalytic domain homologues [Lyophyllum shimeji]